MDYNDAKRRVWCKRVIGIVIALACGLFTAGGLLKALYFSIEGGGLFTQMFRPLQIGIDWIYQHTYQWPLVWTHSPVPSLYDLWSAPNAWFLLMYFGSFVGVAIARSANVLAERLGRIDVELENQRIKESVQGVVRSRQQLQAIVQVPSVSIWSALHENYWAPLIVGIALLVLGKLLG